MHANLIQNTLLFEEEPSEIFWCIHRETFCKFISTDRLGSNFFLCMLEK